MPSWATEGSGRSLSRADPLAVVEAALLDTFGPRPARASVSFVGVEQIVVLRFDVSADGADGDDAAGRVYVSLGMSRHPMTGADASQVDETAPRAELVLRVRAGSAVSGDRDADLWRSLAVLAAAPVVEAVVHRRGATVDLGRPWAAGSRWTGAVIDDDAGPAITVAAWRKPVSLLRVIPATADELAWARVHGGEALLARWAEQGTELSDPGRGPVLLS